VTAASCVRFFESTRSVYVEEAVAERRRIDRTVIRREHRQRLI
jgi:hypothetical protein